MGPRSAVLPHITLVAILTCQAGAATPESTQQVLQRGNLALHSSDVHT